MEQEQNNDEIDMKAANLNSYDPFKVVMVLGTIILTLVIILAFYGGAAYACSTLDGTLTSTALCYTPQEVERLEKLREAQFDSNGMKNLGLEIDNG